MNTFAVPKSGRKILVALASSEYLDIAQIRKKTGLPERTLRFALARLKKQEFISETPEIFSFGDMRKKVIKIKR
ncbi:MAG: hypothetical protein V1492_00805 [Candidatus Micrarchaeota archaeon]